MKIIKARAETASQGRVLFVAEAVTLAHVVRTNVLAEALHQDGGFDIHLASDSRYDHLFPNRSFSVRNMRSIPSEDFLEALAKGRTLYTTETLRDYVREDLEMLDEIHPDIVVGDFRLSLAVSARLKRIPYMAICNAYWSPYAQWTLPLPELPFNRWFGVKLAGLLFKSVAPLALAWQSRPLNRVAREHGLKPFGNHLRHVYTEADIVLYADIPEIIPTVGLPPNHHYLGPIIWSPHVSLPNWWQDLPDDRPLIYVTPGSSGSDQWLAVCLDALSQMPVTVVAATAGRNCDITADNCFAADYLPGGEAARRASLVICNGGSPTTQQALVAGTPVLGIANNLDQFLNMRALTEAGVGELLRAGDACMSTIRTTVQKMLASEEYADACTRFAAISRNYRAPTRLNALLLEILDASRSSPSAVAHTSAST